MESLPRFAERGEAEQEMIEGLKKSFVVLCEKMKAHIENGAYDALVSDDTGGRIPTLIFREIFKLVNPKRKFQTLFVASGSNYYPKTTDEEKKLADYLKAGIGDSKSVLLVTQYIHSGGTLERLVAELKNTGVENIDVSTIDATGGKEEILANQFMCDNVYIGSLKDKRQFGFSENHNVLSGISKSREYSPIPMRLDDAIENKDIKRHKILAQKEHDELLGYDRDDDWEVRNKKIDDSWKNEVPKLDAIPLSDEEEAEIQQNINKTRVHIKKLAEEIVQEVWGGTK